MAMTLDHACMAATIGWIAFGRPIGHEQFPGFDSSIGRETRTGAFRKGFLSGPFLERSLLGRFGGGWFTADGCQQKKQSDPDPGWV